jgi:hypothetical protein
MVVRAALGDTVNQVFSARRFGRASRYLPKEAFGLQGPQVPREPEQESEAVAHGRAAAELAIWLWLNVAQQIGGTADLGTSGLKIPQKRLHTAMTRHCHGFLHWHVLPA